jgi:ketopantoate hydroxymethyltransferase
MSSFLGRLAFNAGLERIEAPTAAMLSTVELVVAVGLSVVFLGDALAAHTVTGAAMILGATLLLTHMEMRVARTAPAAVVLDDSAHPSGRHPAWNGKQSAARWIRRIRSGARGAA